MTCERCGVEIHAEEEILDHFHGWDSAQLSGPLFVKHPGWSGKVAAADGPKDAEGQAVKSEQP